MSVPPNEWPMMIGGDWSASISPLMVDGSSAGTVAVAIDSGFSRSASTSTSKPGYVGVRTLKPLAS